MSSARFFITPQELWALIGTADCPCIIDTRRQEIYRQSERVLPASVWRDPQDAAGWSSSLDRGKTFVVACKAGHELSQMVAAMLREQGFAVSVLDGGYAGWADAKLPLLSKAARERFAPQSPSLWVTRRRPKIDRIACPWLIRRFVDPQARFLFVDPPQAEAVARETGAVAFDIEGVALSHDGERCTFDTMLKVFGLEFEPCLARLALIVRGADTARHDLAPEAPGLHAISLGLSVRAGDDDHGLLRAGFALYDALFAWVRFAVDERHNWPARAA